MLKGPYSLWKRRLPSGTHIYYSRFRFDDGSWSTAKSAGQTTKTAAAAWAVKYLNSGQIVLFVIEEHKSLVGEVLLFLSSEILFSIIVIGNLSDQT